MSDRLHCLQFRTLPSSFIRQLKPALQRSGEVCRVQVARKRGQHSEIDLGAWRRAVCNEEWRPTAEKRVRVDDGAVDEALFTGTPSADQSWGSDLRISPHVRSALSQLSPETLFVLLSMFELPDLRYQTPELQIKSGTHLIITSLRIELYLSSQTGSACRQPLKNRSA